MSKSNTQKNSGGVKTEAGKMISKYNSIKHGILRESVAECEKIEVENIYNNLASDINPDGDVEELLVEMIATNVIKLQRIARAERQFIGDFSHNSSKTDETSLPVSVADSLLIYSRYQTSAENRIFRILGALKYFKESK